METLIILSPSAQEIRVCACGQVSLIAQNWEDTYPLRIIRRDNFFPTDEIPCNVCNYFAWHVVPGVLTLLRGRSDPYITAGDWHNLRTEREAAKAAYRVFRTSSPLPICAPSLKIPVLATIYGRRIARDKEE